MMFRVPTMSHAVFYTLGHKTEWHKSPLYSEPDQGNKAAAPVEGQDCEGSVDGMRWKHKGDGA